MRIGRSSLVVLGIIFAVLVAFSCGDDDGDGPDADTGPYGGPYPFKKLADFRFYKDQHLSFSKVEKLNEDLWLGSIKSNRVAGFGDELQKYNYAIDADGNIFVGVWDLGGDHERLGRIMSNPYICSTSNIAVSAEGSGDWSSLKNIVDQEMMIDWYPDKTETKPCSLTVGGGLLDALSKHFMLAQGPKEGRISNYDQAKWLKAEVAYAGEIFVYVEECTFTLNGDSGTYGPKRDDGIGQPLAEDFHAVLGVAPTKVNKYEVKDLEMTIPGLGC